MDCVTEETLCAYADQDLPAEDRQGVAAHLAECALCRGKLLLLQRTDEALAEEPMLEPSPAFTRKVMAQASHQRMWLTSRRPYLALAACVALGVGLWCWAIWRTDLGRGYEKLWIRANARIEQVVASGVDELGRALPHLSDWSEARARWMSDGLVTAARVAQEPWFLPVVLMSLLGLALYEALASLCEDLELGSAARLPRR